MNPNCCTSIAFPPAPTRTRLQTLRCWCHIETRLSQVTHNLLLTRARISSLSSLLPSCLCLPPPALSSPQSQHHLHFTRQPTNSHPHGLLQARLPLPHRDHVRDRRRYLRRRPEVHRAQPGRVREPRVRVAGIGCVQSVPSLSTIQLTSVFLTCIHPFPAASGSCPPPTAHRPPPDTALPLGLALGPRPRPNGFNSRLPEP